MHLCDNISLHRRGPQHHSIKTPVFGKFEIRLCSPKASVPSPPPPPPPTLSSWVGQRLSKKLSNLCLGIDPPSRHIHMRKHTRTCTYTGTCTLPHTRISSTTPQTLIPTVASPGFWPRLCGAVGKRGGDPGLLGEQLQEGHWWAHLTQGRVGGTQRGVCVCAQCVKA